MTPPRDSDDWLPLHRLNGQFEVNLAAIAARYPEIAAQLRQLPRTRVWIRLRDEVIDCGTRREDGTISTDPNPLSAASAQQIVTQLFPTGQCTQPVLVAGLDQAWLWLRLHGLPVSMPTAPGHRPPLYFLCGNLERLATVMHLHDLRGLLGDSRVRIFCGPDAVDQFQSAAIVTPELPVPRLSVTVEPALWRNGTTLDTTLRAIGSAWETSFATLKSRLQFVDARFDGASLASRIRGGTPLRILGVTSRFTTFLQYSMRDWLESLRSLGHETRIVIEDADHEQIHPLNIAQISVDFQPDLVVLIDHFRAEIVGLPQAVPTVMWVQDRLPNLFRASAGAAQQPTDYAIGQGRVECVHTFGYPSQRFMPAMIGTNPVRFSVSSEIDRQLVCDISFVSHASQSAQSIIDAEIAKLGTPHAKALLVNIFESLKSIYNVGGCVTQPHEIEAIIQRTLLETQTSVPDPQPLLDLFTHRVNNALFRHQAIGWVAEMNVDLRLYGKGWECHPQFSRFARGVADNQRQLASVYRSSKINLQITPFGAAHQRLFDGLAAGGFFLLRRCPGDRFDQVLRELSRWCSAHNITDDPQLQQYADESVRSWLSELQEIDGRSVVGRGYDFIAELAVTEAEGFVRSAGTLWPEFDEVSFASKSKLQQKVRNFLAAPLERRRLATPMRERVVQSLTYRAISERMLRFIASDLESKSISRAA